MVPGKDMAAQLTLGARYLGSSLLLTQGAGGNNSVKDFSNDMLWIKASGIRLSETSGPDAFVGLGLNETRNGLRDPALRSLPSAAAQERSVQTFLAATRSSRGLRPSLETGMHASLPHKAVVHTHSVYINAFACMVGGQQVAASVLPEHRWIPYVTPGFELGLAVEKTLDQQAGQGPLAIVLENHGFIAAAASAREAVAISENFVAAAGDFFGALEDACLAQEAPTSGMLDLIKQVQQSSRSSESAPVIRAGRFAMFRCGTDRLRDTALFPFVPDDVVYLGASIWRVPSLDEAALVLRRALDNSPRVALVVPKSGVVFAAPSQGLLDAMEEALLAHLLIAQLIGSKGSPRPLAAGSINELLAMESEKYRQSLAGRLEPEDARCRS